MQKIKMLALWAFVVLTFQAQAQNKTIKFETGSFDEVVAKAKKEKKPIFMDAYTVWCGPCKWMDKNVFTDPNVAEFYSKNFIAYKSDMEKGEGKTLAKKFNVQAYPSLLFLNSDGELIHSSIGAREAESFIQLGKEALNPETQFASLHKKFTAGERKPEFMVRYIKAMNDGGQDPTESVNKYYSTLKPADLTSAANWKIINTTAAGGLNSLTQYFIDNQVAYAKKYAADSVTRLVQNIYFSQAYNAVSKADRAGFDAAKAKLDKMKFSETDERNIPAGLAQMELSFLEKEGNIPAYASAASKFVDTYLMSSAAGLNNFAWSFYEKVDDKSYLTKAEGWAKKAVELEPSYANLDTHAAVLYKLGKKDEAKVIAEKAIAQGKKEKEDVTATEALLTKIKSM